MAKKLKNIQNFEQHTDKNLNISDVSESKLINFINRLGDFFSIMCPKCAENGIKSRMKKDHYFTSGGMCGPGDSMYWVCPICKHEEGMPND